MFGANGADSCLAELAPAQYLARGNWMCWMRNGEILRSKEKFRSLHWGGGQLLQPSSSGNIYKRHFPQLDNVINAMKFFYLGKRNKVKKVKCSYGVQQVLVLH